MRISLVIFPSPVSQRTALHVFRNRDKGFDKVESLGKGRDGVWGREGKAFLQKGVPSLPQFFTNHPHKTKRVSSGEARPGVTGSTRTP